MFSYRHLYHAGNHADVFKHVVLIALIEALQKKDAGLCYHDTHAGIGLYDLQSPQAQKNSEFEQGIGLLFDNTTGAPALVERYVSLVRQVNARGSLSYYPGSPMIARNLLREQDEMVLSELNPADFEQLRAGFMGDRQTHVHKLDAYQGMNSLLPPKLKRGLVLIDPPYELKTEVKDLCDGLKKAYSKWSSGCYAVWYPKLERPFVETVLRKMRGLGVDNILHVGLDVRDPPGEHRMIGSRMIIINPPWQIETALRPALEYLHRILSFNREGDAFVEWLVPEAKG